MIPFYFMASKYIDINALVEKINSSHACFLCSFVITDNNLSLSNWLSDWRHWLNTNTLFPELFCLWAVCKRHNNYWIILELMISSDAISLNTWVNIAGRISLHLPGLWECLIFEEVCWRKTVKRKGKKRGTVVIAISFPLIYY